MNTNLLHRSWVTRTKAVLLCIAPSCIAINLKFCAHSIQHMGKRFTRKQNCSGNTVKWCCVTENLTQGINKTHSKEEISF